MPCWLCLALRFVAWYGCSLWSAKSILIECVLIAVLLLMLQCEWFLSLKWKKLFYCLHLVSPFGCAECFFHYATLEWHNAKCCVALEIILYIASCSGLGGSMWHRTYFVYQCCLVDTCSVHYYDSKIMPLDLACVSGQSYVRLPSLLVRRAVRVLLSSALFLPLFADICFPFDNCESQGHIYCLLLCDSECYCIVVRWSACVTKVLEILLLRNIALIN